MSPNTKKNLDPVFLWTVKDWFMS